MSATTRRQPPGTPHPPRDFRHACGDSWACPAATNRMTSIAGFTPSYDANGNVLNDTTTPTPGTPTATLSPSTPSASPLTPSTRVSGFEGLYLQTLREEVVLANPEVNMNGQSLVKAFVPLPGQAVAVYTSAGLDARFASWRQPRSSRGRDRHRVSGFVLANPDPREDWLGSARLTSLPSRTFVSSSAYAPFGEPHAQSGTQDLSFTGEGQDTVSGDYDFLFREYSTLGRWVPGFVLGNPESNWMTPTPPVHPPGRASPPSPVAQADMQTSPPVSVVDIAEERHP
jgi:hypothetical protein